MAKSRMIGKPGSLVYQLQIMAFCAACGAQLLGGLTAMWVPVDDMSYWELGAMIGAKLGWFQDPYKW